MAKKKSGNMMGSWSFLIGVILAVLVGFAGSTSTAVMYILVLLGLIIGLLNIGDEEVSPFLMSGAILVIVSSFGREAVSNIPYYTPILRSLIMLFVPATIIVALKHVFSMARR